MYLFISTVIIIIVNLSLKLSFSITQKDDYKKWGELKITIWVWPFRIEEKERKKYQLSVKVYHSI